MNDYNSKWCNERHGNIDKEFKAVWERFKTLDARLWAILILLVFNLGGVILSIALKMGASP